MLLLLWLMSSVERKCRREEACPLGCHRQMALHRRGAVGEKGSLDTQGVSTWLCARGTECEYSEYVADNILLTVWEL